MRCNLEYRRQFILANQLLEVPAGWQRFVLKNEVLLYAHHDLECTMIRNGNRAIALCGFIVDPDHPSKSNDELLHTIFKSANVFEDVVHALRSLTGRYVVIYASDSGLSVIHDPLGLREVYYVQVSNAILCGSQPNLVSNFSKPHLPRSTDESKCKFFTRDMPSVRSGRLWVGTETLFEGVMHLPPNHYFDAMSRKSIRYWPTRRIEATDIDLAAAEASTFLQGAVEAVTRRYNVMMAVTAGIDSRSLLAASRNVRHDIYYFVNMESHLKDERCPDIAVPRKLFSDLDVEFHVHGEIESCVPEEFRRVFLENVFMSTELILPTIYNVYFRHHQDKMNLLGVGEIARDYYGAAPKELSGYYLAYKLGYEDSAYATKQCEAWMREALPVCEAVGMNIMDLHLWENLLGSWGVVGNSESDIAIEEFDPYSSHLLYEVLLSVPLAVAGRKRSRLFRKMFEQMWPELTELPFNPAHGVREHCANLARLLGIHGMMKKAEYRRKRRRFLGSHSHACDS